MCDPVTATMLALSAAQSAAGFVGQSQAYNAAVDGYEQQVKNNNKALVQQYAFDQNEIQQEQNAASQKKFEANIEALETTASQRVASGEAGIDGGGYTASSLLGSQYAKLGRYNANVDDNFSMVNQRIRGEMEQNMNRTNSANRQAYNALGPRPSPLSIFSNMDFGALGTGLAKSQAS